MKTAVQSIAPVPQHPQIRKKENTVTVATVSSSVMEDHPLHQPVEIMQK